MEYAGVTRRFVALVIDGFVLLGISVVVGLLAGGAYSTSTANSYDAGIQVDTGPMLAALALFFAYYVISEALFGRTLGKRILSLRVVSEDGSPISLGAAFLRNLLRLVDGLFFYLVSAIAVWASPTRQRLGDRAAHTCVVLDSGSTYLPRASAMTEWRPPPGLRRERPDLQRGRFQVGPRARRTVQEPTVQLNDRARHANVRRF
jgi:uncharacterized RDD family membrane protein YckC